MEDEDVGIKTKGTSEQSVLYRHHKIRIHNEANGPHSTELQEESVYDSKETLLQTIILEREDQVLVSIAKTRIFYILSIHASAYLGIKGPAPH